MAAAGNPVIIGIPVPFTAMQMQAEAKLFPRRGGVFGPVAASSAAKHDELARVFKKIEKRELKIQTDPEYGVGSCHRTALDVEVDVLWFRHRYIRYTLNLPAQAVNLLDTHGDTGCILAFTIPPTDVV